MKTSHAAALLLVTSAALLSACSREKPPVEALRAVRTAEVRYDRAPETNRYFGSVQARYEVDQAFRVGGKIVTRKVDVGQKVRAGRGPRDTRRHRLQARRRGGSATAGCLAGAGAAGAVRSAAPECVEGRRLGQPCRRGESAKRCGKHASDRGSRSAEAGARAQSRRVRHAARVAGRRGYQRQVRGGPGRGRRAADRLDREGGRARDRRQRAGGSALGIQGVALQGVRSRARPTRRSMSCCANCRRRRRRKRERSAPASSPRRRARCRSARAPRSSSTARSAEQPAAVNPRRGDHAEQGPAGGVGRSSRRRPSRSERFSCSPSSVHEYRNDRCSCPARTAGELVVTAGVQKMAPGLEGRAARRRAQHSNRSRPTR